MDVGTSSARAGLVKKTEAGGKLLKYHSEEIKIFKPEVDYFEQSSDDIWKKVCECVKKVSADVPKDEIVGIGFDATCSLVLLDANLQPLTASPTEKNDQNVIMWLDHRAKLEANFINSLQHEILKFVGGKVSLEMEIPKLLWLKKNMELTSFQKIHRAFDLPDFLTWRATGEDSRSICSLTCKWNYDAINRKWSSDYFESIGLHELLEKGFAKIGTKVLFPGDRVSGLTENAAQELGLLPGTSVGTSMIDAHAGALGLIASHSSIPHNDTTAKLILIAGTSTCHMSVTEDCLYSPGIWGPYKHALLPNHFLIEAGQSAAGEAFLSFCLLVYSKFIFMFSLFLGILIDQLVNNHPDYQQIKADLKQDERIYTHLFNEIMKLAASQKVKTFHELTKDFHIYPDFHGNRSPIGDSNLKGAISGCTMHDSIFVTYLAVVQSLAYSTKHIINSLYQSGRKEFKSILICGGLSKNKLYVQAHADICGIPVLISNEDESVLVGAAMLGAKASGIYTSLESAVDDLSSSCYQIDPNSESNDYHARKYQVFIKMLDDQQAYAKIMSG